ncbi:hypothetical protein FDECE_9759 [Fusarium decemcellulare]|nr:hypothetical protein FDECE_9759 [Fusarium decemcellulare]
MPRQKVSAACDNCRWRKVKCDALQPVFSLAEVFGNWGTASSKSDTYMASQRPPVPTDSTADMFDAIIVGPMTLSEKSMSTPCSTQSSAHTTNTPLGRVTMNKRDADAMTGMVVDPSTSVEFFGSSSAASFMKQINAAIDARLGRAQVSTSDQNSKAIADPLAYTLPQRSFADSLLKDYYGLVWVILPVHDWTIFRGAYQSVWLGSPTLIPEPILYCMINLAFALGSQFSQAIPPSERREMGQTFWRRAHLLYDPRLKEGACLEGVQCLLLMGLFLQSTCESHECWMTVGSAIRMAQSLGLHQSLSMRKNEGARETEIARRVWHGCVFMDRVLSMTFGRPSMVADWLSDAVPLPLMIDDDFLDTQTKAAATRPDGRTTEVAFFIKSLELYRIVNDSLLRLYMGPKEEATIENDNDTLASVLQLDSRLTQWVRSIPCQLSTAFKAADEDFIFQRQRIVLRARASSSVVVCGIVRIHGSNRSFG